MHIDHLAMLHIPHSMGTEVEMPSVMARNYMVEINSPLLYDHLPLQHLTP